MAAEAGARQSDAQLGEAVAQPARATGIYAWYVSFVLMLCATLSFADSSLLYILVEAIKADLKLSDTQIGLITGPAFALTYAIFALPLARISDRSLRKVVICGAIVAWSAITAAAGLARGFVTFALTRAGVAIGESALAPAAISMIADRTTVTTRPIATAIYTLGTPIGTAVALAVGGFVSDRYGWRAAFMMIGSAGIFLALLVAFTVREPARRSDVARHDLPKGSLRDLVGDPAVRNLMLGGATTGLSFGALKTWAPAYAMRTFHLSASEVGATFGGVQGMVGIAGMLIGGLATSWLTSRRPGHPFRMLGLLLVIATATQFFSLVAPSYGLFLVLVAGTSFCVSFYSAPTMSAIQSLVDPKARSFSAAVTIFGISGIGMASSTFLTGLLSDLLRPALGPASLRWAFLLPTFAHLWAAVHYYLAAKAIDRQARAAR
jgi:predicted MFS family arabinose efflux permease